MSRLPKAALKKSINLESHSLFQTDEYFNMQQSINKSFERGAQMHEIFLLQQQMQLPQIKNIQASATDKLKVTLSGRRSSSNKRSDRSPAID